MASLLDLADARLRGLLDSRKVERPSMVGLLGNREPQGSLAGALQGYAPPQMTAMTNPQVMDYARNVAQSAQQNLQTQMSDLDRALVMDQGGVNVGDRQALARLMEQVPGLMGATAYHGTPHNIRGQFDISKVGTGEGAQAYGHGMYFAENPSVAKQYLVNAESQKTPEGMARSYLQDYPSEKEALLGAKERLQRLQENGTADLIQQQEQVVKALESGKLGGNLYKVDIPDEYIPKMIEWDKPFKKQPQNLQDIFAKVNPIAVLQKDPSNEFTRWLRLPSTSKELQEMGYKGIKYKDAGSRGEGTKTFNYVVFDPTDVKILERNNKKLESLLD